MGLIVVVAGCVVVLGWAFLYAFSDEIEKPKLQLGRRITMLEVEEVLGRPDRVQVDRGRVEDDLEFPTVIRWYYSRWRITSSTDRFGDPGYLTFLPKRFVFPRRGEDGVEIDPPAVGRSEEFVLFSFQGSFPVDLGVWGNGSVPEVYRVRRIRNHE